MKQEIPILYSTFMAQAKVAWRKTQTRRLVKPQLHPDGTEIVDSGKPWNKGKGRWHNRFKIGENPVRYQIASLHDCPYGEVGSILWGRECVNKGENGNFHYKTEELGPLNEVRWTPSIHMPKEAARIWDENTGIRAERVADISEEDCIAEGIEISKHSRTGGTIYKCYDGQNDFEYSPKESYKSLWQLINGKPKAIQERQNGKLVTIGYEVYPFDEYAAAEFAGLTTWKKKPLSVITNPWVWVIESKQLSVNGKP